MIYLDRGASCYKKTVWYDTHNKRTALRCNRVLWKEDKGKGIASARSGAKYPPNMEIIWHGVRHAEWYIMRCILFSKCMWAWAYYRATSDECSSLWRMQWEKLNQNIIFPSLMMQGGCFKIKTMCTRRLIVESRRNRIIPPHALQERNQSLSIQRELF